MDWIKYIKRTAYAKEADRLANAFRVGKVVSYADLQNAPIKLGASVCGISTYVLVQDLNKVIADEKAEDIPPVAKRVAPASAPVKPPVVKASTGLSDKAPAGKPGSGGAPVSKG